MYSIPASCEVQINTDTSRLCRSLYILACLRGRCQGLEGSWRCFRYDALRVFTLRVNVHARECT